MGRLIGLDARAANRGPNGLGTYARGLIAKLAELDTVNSYIVIRRPDTGPPMAAGPRVREVEMPGDASTPNFGHRVSRLGLDLYHSLHHFLPIGLRVPRIVVTLHDLIWLEHRDLIRGGPMGTVIRHVTHVYARQAMGGAVRRADRVVAISEYTRSRAIAYFGLDPSRIDVVHHGVAPDAFSSPHAATPEQPPYFLCLGNSRPYKNLPTAVRAFAACAADVPAARLVVTGRGDSTSELRALARQLGVLDRVTFTGLVEHDELLHLLHGATALIFPSLVEGFGLPVVEAMAAGCPVVASNCPTLVEVAGPAALLCDPSRPEEFAAAMRRLVADPTLGADLRRRGLAHAAGFTWTRCAEQTLAVYDALFRDSSIRRVAAR